MTHTFLLFRFFSFSISRSLPLCQRAHTQYARFFVVFFLKWFYFSAISPLYAICQIVIVPTDKILCVDTELIDTIYITEFVVYLSLLLCCFFSMFCSPHAIFPLVQAARYSQISWVLLKSGGLFNVLLLLVFLLFFPPQNGIIWSGTVCDTISAKIFDRD